MSSERADRIGVPRDVFDASQSPGYDATRPAVARAQMFLRPDDPGRLLVLAGPPGTGKSSAAARSVIGAREADRAISIVGQAAPEMITGGLVAARWVPARDLWHGIFDASLWRAVGRIPVLVLDDLGAEPKDEDRVTPSIAALLCDRVDAGRKTLVTTNMDHISFGRRYGPRVVDRLIGDAWFGLRGASLRR